MGGGNGGGTGGTPPTGALSGLAAIPGCGEAALMASIIFLLLLVNSPPSSSVSPSRALLARVLMGGGSFSPLYI